MKLQNKIVAIFFSFALWGSAEAQWSVNCTNCGNEVTQYMNYGELLSQTVQSAQQLATQVSQYMTMVQNLQQLPAQVIGGVLSPFGDQAGDLLKLYNAATSLSFSASQAQNVVNGTLQGGVSMNLTPTQYAQYIAQQAQNRGGVFAKMFNDNNQKLQDLQKTSAAFKTASDNVPNLQGNLDGLAQLNTLAAASGNVATDMLAVNRQALSIKLDEKTNEAAGINMAEQVKQQRIDDMNANLDALGTGLKANKTWR